MAGHVAMIGTLRREGTVSMNTLLWAGGCAGSRKTLDCATSINEGTVRPEAASRVCPSRDEANSIKVQAASFWLDDAARQKASLCRMPASTSPFGSGATSHSK